MHRVTVVAHVAVVGRLEPEESGRAFDRARHFVIRVRYRHAVLIHDLQADCGNASVGIHDVIIGLQLHRCRSAGGSQDGARNFSPDVVEADRLQSPFLKRNIPGDYAGLSIVRFLTPYRHAIEE
jgi:hypothetical protein